jgi:hypothetical protein
MFSQILQANNMARGAAQERILPVARHVDGEASCCVSHESCNISTSSNIIFGAYFFSL